MKINFAHLKERAQSGGWINFAVFEARSNSGTSSDNSTLLANLTMRARSSKLKVDQSALAFSANGRIQFFGSPPLVEYLSRNGLPGWNYSLDA